MAQHPLSDPAARDIVEDPDERLGIALGDLYGRYGRGEYMLEMTTRDLGLVAAM